MSETSSNEPLTVCSAAEDNYAMGLAVAAVSVLKHAPQTSGEPIRLVILDGGIQPENWRRFEQSIAGVTTNVEIQRIRPDLSGFEGFQRDYGNSCMTYARLLLPRLLPETKRLLYFDSDLVVTRSWEPVWELDLKGNLLAAAVCQEVRTFGRGGLPLEELGLQSDERYLQAGFMLIDLDAWRCANFGQKCIGYLNTFPNHAPNWDQSAINAVVAGSWVELEPEWNTPAGFYEEAIPRGVPLPAVLHYSGPYKPWQYGTHRWKSARAFYDLLGETAWRGWRPSTLRHYARHLKWRAGKLLGKW